MKLCIGCGTKYEEDSKFCLNCGMDIKDKEPSDNINHVADNVEEDHELQKASTNDSYIFKKLDQDTDNVGFSFKKIDENTAYAPIDRMTPIKNKVKAFTGKIKEKIDASKLFVNNKIAYIKKLDTKKQTAIKIGLLSCTLLILVGTIGFRIYITSEQGAFSAAARYEKQQEYTSAIEIYKDILEKNPNNLIVKEKLGLIYLDYLRDMTLAERYLLDVINNSEDPSIRERFNYIFPIVVANPFPDDDKVYTDLISVELTLTAPNAKIMYSIRNSEGETPFTEYTGFITLSDGENTVIARGISSYGLESEPYIFSFNVNVEDKFIEFSNVDLENKIKGALGTSNIGRLRQSDINNIYSIHIIGDSISINQRPEEDEESFEAINLEKGNWNNLQDLIKFKNLQELVIAYQSDVGALDFIGSLSNLKKLTLINSNINNLQFLVKGEHLEYLDLSNNQIQSLNGIQGILNIKNLNLSHNLINDAYHLSNLTGLTTLHITENQIEDITVLDSLVELEEFYFDDDLNIDYEFLSNMTKLKNLYVKNHSNNRFLYNHDSRDISAISKLSSLEYLTLSGIGIRDIENLSSLANLKYLDLSFNNITLDGLNYLGKLSNLEYLNLEGN